jgi:leucine dehydrogenase
MTTTTLSLTNPKVSRRLTAPSGDPLITDITAEARTLAAFNGHEQVFDIRDPRLGLAAIIAIHDTTLGPALGGCRMIDYATRQAGLTDALRLSAAMTYKSALADLNLGGGKTVVFDTPSKERSEALFRSLGRAIDSLGGQYITGEDSGTSVRDIDWISQETDYVIGTSARGGNPSHMTALGVLAGIKVAVQYRLGYANLSGLTVAVQGLGNVGLALCEQLAAAGVRLTVTDINCKRVEAVVEQFGAKSTDPGKIHTVAADVFVPCALGAGINDQTVPDLRCAVVAGSANNQLANHSNGDALHRRGILYAPDYVVNAGGLISAERALRGQNPSGQASIVRVKRIGATLKKIFGRSDAENIAPAAVADYMAEERLLRARSQHALNRRESA